MQGFDLKIERLKKRLSLSDVSKRIGKSIGWISMLENDSPQVKLTPDIVKLYMDAINED